MERNYFKEPMTLEEANKLVFKTFTMTAEEAKKKAEEIRRLCDSMEKASDCTSIMGLVINI